jgi:hypothetical protein
MPRGKPAKQICIRIDPDLLAAIDVDLGGEAKTAWMSSAFRIKLGWEAVKGGPAPPAEPLESAKRADADQRRVQAEKITRVPGTNIIRTGSPSLTRGLQARPKASAKGKGS